MVAMKSLRARNKMSTLKVLKEYLVGDGGYLLNDDNNGKTVMLSGAWGSGKTHFWLQDIDPQLTKENQKNIYISLYGRESIAELKFEVLKEAYNLEVKDDIISKSASMLSTIAPSLGEKSLVDGFDKLNKKAKEKKAEEILKSGSIICLDDFERKSKNIDLNDLFGYISQLALDYHCKVVIILNSDVFEGEEANVFKTVKEKTVNKFFYFEPTRKELFDSIYDRKNEKYKSLNDYKEDIFNAIDETEELNARIYIQVLDNCLEWIEKNYGNSVFRVLVMSSIYFIKTNETLQYTKIHDKDAYSLTYTKWEKYPMIQRAFVGLSRENIFVGRRSNGITETHEICKREYLDILKKKSVVMLFNQYVSHITSKNKQTYVFSETEQLRHLERMENYRMEISLFWKYGYQLYMMDNIEKIDYEKIVDFVMTGILLKTEDIPS